MTFLTKAKHLLTERDFKLINVEDLKESRQRIVKKIRMCRDEIRQSKDPAFKQAKAARLEVLLVINDELKDLIEAL